MLLGICNESRADHERGCLLLSANLEHNVDDKVIATLVRRNETEVEAIFEKALRRAQQRGDLVANKDPAVQGMRQVARATPDRAALGRIAGVAISTPG